MHMKDAIKGYVLDCKIEGQTLKHITGKERLLNRLQAWCEARGVVHLEDMNSMLMKEYVVHLQTLVMGDEQLRRSNRGKKLSAHSVVDYTKMIRAFFAWSEREGYVAQSPMRRVPRVKIPEFVITTFTPQQMQALLDTCDVATAMGFRNYAIMLVFMDTGIRVSELCGLKLDDVHDNYLRVLGKFEKTREVGIGATAARALFKYIHQFREARSDAEKHVFLSRTGKPLYSNYVWHVLHDAGERVGIEGIRVSPHTLRHSFAVGWLANKGDVVSLSRTLGHTKLETTQIYLKDFQSREARLHHDEFSPVEVHKLGRRKSRKADQSGV